MGNWTKGEWEIENGGIEGNDGIICDYVYGEANAHLISAAPNMAEALEDITNKVIELCQSYGHPLPEYSIDMARKALSKAKGE